MEQYSSRSKEKMFFAFLAGFLYLLAGSIQFVFSLSTMLGLFPVISFENGLIGIFFAPSDLIGSLILVLIGSIFIYGLTELRTGLNEGIAYIYVGILISLLFATVYVLVMAGNWMDSFLLNGPETNGWDLLYDLRPAIYLGILPLCGYLIWRKEFRAMNK
ncbi:MAG: hypothetical protein A4E24_01655 [Methanomethylovorans sp. PtaU1.Bin093]|jgi:amino acid transporter|uniref:hypothetical protein n=1 Tax=Methanomethylovorans sp. PtaU1.Bin093 TaxID=1811679 RepID=UPI0009C9C6A4|nr:hypothetical protein [Methanomethylovorans sp. PtaU1.Bin093]OPY19496.1 MAG: hypothetical protein A4E24_01655 [Methanomethylovorans sp. PtaU1.Bin093]